MTVPITDSSDQDLVAATQAGSHEAFSILVERHYHPIVQYLATLNSDLALDASQEAFLLAFQRITQLTAGEAFRSWLYTIARRCLFDAQYQQNRYLNQIKHTIWLNPPITHPADVYLLQDLVRQVLTNLGETDRRILLLRHYLGYNAQEIGQALGIATATAQRRINRAEARFRKGYDDESQPIHDRSSKSPEPPQPGHPIGYLPGYRDRSAIIILTDMITSS